MSDEEEVYSDEEVEEEEEEIEEEEEEEKEDEEEEKEAEEEKKPPVVVEQRRASRQIHFGIAENDEGMSKNEIALMAAKMREDEEKGKLQDYEERRKKEREIEEEELKKLKEKQERRRLEREQEEREIAEKKRLEEERRQQEEQLRRQRQEEEKRKKEEEKTKRQQLISFPSGQGGRNFVISAKTEKNDKFGNIVQAKQEMGMTKDQQEEAKKAFMIAVRNAIPEVSEVPASELKAKIKELHSRICKLETHKYDLEKRHERQQYDLKELNERSRQVARNAGGKQGGGDSETGGRHPPKVQVFSKYDRQIDRRNFKERRSMYEHKNAFPCFPGVLPPPVTFEKTIKKYEYEIQEEDEDEGEEIEDYE